MTDFTNNEQTVPVDIPQETVTYPTGPRPQPPVETFPVTRTEESSPITKTEESFPVARREDFTDIPLEEPYMDAFEYESRPAKKNTSYIIFLIISVIVIIVLVAGFIFYHTKTTSQVRSLETRIDELETNNMLLEEEKKITASEHSGEISDLQSRIDELEEENSELSMKANFMDKFIKVVEDDSARTYHTYGCEYFDDSYFWAYNKEQVINNSSYTKCPYCN